MKIRALHPSETSAVLDLWRAADALPSPTDTADDIQSLLKMEHATFLVAEVEGEIAGSIIATFDGWRGHIYRLAVHPAHRRKGIAQKLVKQAEERFAQLGVKRAIALVDQTNPVAMSFWFAAGYSRDNKLTRFFRSLA